MPSKILAPPLPSSFSGLMEMYEGNYIRLRKLLGDKAKIPEVAVSRISNGMDLYLQVLEQTKYTSTIALTYYFSDPKEGFQAYPNLKLRIYYDALQAEVMSRAYRRPHIQPQIQPQKQQDPNFHAFNHKADPSLLKRWRMNRFLYKWLAYCDHQGHSFQNQAKSGDHQLITKNIEIPLQEKASSSNIIE